MKESRSSATRKHRARHEKYHLRLFVAGDEPNSRLAREKLTKLCEERLKGHYALEVVDVLEDFQAALDNNVLVTPTLLLTAPLPRVMIVGTLSDADRVLTALRINGGE